MRVGGRFKVRRNVSTVSFVVILLFMLTLLLSVVSASSEVEAKVTATIAEMVTDEANKESTLQDWFDINGYAINVTEDELGTETFDPGSYQISILAEISGHASLNNLSWYPISSDLLQLVFLGLNSTGDKMVFKATETFGLCLGTTNSSFSNDTNHQLFYTETNLNQDEFDHALVFLNPNPPGGYIIAWEDLWEGGDKDFQDMILTMNAHIDVDIKPYSYPNAINIKNKGVIPVAVFGTDTFDVTTINSSTVFFGSTGTEAQVNMHPNGKYHQGFEDINMDGYLDMVFHFRTQDTGFNIGDTIGMLTGETYSGVSIMGSDSVRINAPAYSSLFFRHA
jgi:hypothetical protein